MKPNFSALCSLALGSAAVVQPAAAAQDKAPKPKKSKSPNIVVILADDLGFGDIACNGSFETIATPNIDRLAAMGVRFTDAHATAATSTPARYSILTGEYAWREPGTGVAPGDAAMIVTPQHETMPEMLQRAGYTTAAVGKWHLGLGSETGKQDWNGLITPGLSDIGFGYSYIMAATGDRVPCVYIENGRVVNLDANDPIRVSYTRPFPGEPTGRNNPELLRVHSSHGHDQALINGIGRIGYMTGGKSALWVDQTIADTLTTKALQFMERSVHGGGQPFFLYFATNDIHVPRDPHPRFVGKSGMGPRGDAILEFDWSVGQVLDKLDELGITKNTLIILTSDNGPVVDDGYRDQAVEQLGNHKPWGRMRGGKYSIFEAGTRVPFIAAWKGHMPKGKVSNAPISQVDLYASLAALTGQALGNPRGGEAPDSYNNLTALLGKDLQNGRPYIVEHAFALSVTVDGWKYIEPNDREAYWPSTNTELGNSPQPQLYNLYEDIGERNNLAAQYPDKVRYLSSLLETIKASPERVHIEAWEASYGAVKPPVKKADRNTPARDIP